MTHIHQEDAVIDFWSMPWTQTIVAVLAIITVLLVAVWTLASLVNRFYGFTRRFFFRTRSEHKEEPRLQREAMY
jgi:uncharacterized protein HemY